MSLPATLAADHSDTPSQSPAPVPRAADDHAGWSPPPDTTNDYTTLTTGAAVRKGFLPKGVRPLRGRFGGGMLVVALGVGGELWGGLEERTLRGLGPQGRRLRKRSPQRKFRPVLPGARRLRGSQQSAVLQPGRPGVREPDRAAACQGYGRSDRVCLVGAAPVGLFAIRWALRNATSGQGWPRESNGSPRRVPIIARRTFFVTRADKPLQGLTLG